MTATTTTEPNPSSVRAWLGVAALTASLFVFLTTELMPVGILTPIGSSLGISVGTAGWMVTLYGVSAGLGVPFVVAWTRRLDRRVLLSALLAILTLGNLITSIAPTFPLVLATRLVMGFANGAFWAIGVSIAMRIVPPRQSGRAAAVVMSGISIATVAGIPLGAFIENLIGWRLTFLLWSGLSALVLVTVAVLLPALPSDNAVPVREVFGLAVRNVPLRLVMITIVLFVLGQFGAYTFIRPFLEHRAAAGPGYVTAALMVYGAGGAIGNFVAGHTLTTHLRASFVAACCGLVVSLSLLLAIGHGRIVPMVLLFGWGVAFGAWQLCQVNITLAAAPETFEAAMSLNTLAYNTSIAAGAFAGGLFADRLGVTAVLWFGVVLTTAALLLILGTGRWAPSRQRPANA
ncbi:MFS transporter [Nocardia aurantia]|uniref:Purine ribonucleoside efflux pump NepI n=1 Tax=Nocardia aurantia TaxID=2585199 RepID=A0A7K0DSS3_9NOCA|nr:MFS transporter [Nocardia aurantia]MQY28801.1 Purine ribonucleoside efflux pump NepI [Nocardia aurantia]